MELECGWLQSSSFTGYLAKPRNAAGALPAVVLGHHAWGMDPHFRDVAHRFAAAGYWVLVPDLYAEVGGRPRELSGARLLATEEWLSRRLPVAAWHDAAARERALLASPPTERALIRESLHRLLKPDRDLTPLVERLRSALGWALRQSDVRASQVIVVGFGLGGTLAGQLAAHVTEIRGAVSFYGVTPPVQQATMIRCPMLGLYGAEDAAVTQHVADFAAAMAIHGGSFTYHIFPEAGHAFFHDGHPSYHPQAARQAWAATLAFLSGVVGSPEAPQEEVESSASSAVMT